MIRALLILVTVGLLVGTAQGATLAMQFAGGVNEGTVLPSHSVDVEIWIELAAGDEFCWLFYPNWPDTGFEPIAYSSVEGVEQTAVTGSALNMTGEASAMGTLGDGSQLVDLRVIPWVPENLEGPGQFLLGRQTIHLNNITNSHSTWFNGSVEYDFYPIMFGGIPGSTQELSGGGNHDFIFDPNRADQVGYYTYGQGGSAISGSNGGMSYSLPDNPLKLYCVPEPSSLSLIALGAVVLLRRR